MLVQIGDGDRACRGPALPSDAAINTSEVLTAAVTVSGERYTQLPRSTVSISSRASKQRLEQRLASRSRPSPTCCRSVEAVSEKSRSQEREPVGSSPACPDRAESDRTISRPSAWPCCAAGSSLSTMAHPARPTSSSTSVPLRCFLAPKTRSDSAWRFRGDEALDWLTVVGVAPDIRQQPRPGPRRSPTQSFTCPTGRCRPIRGSCLRERRATRNRSCPAVRTALLELDANVPLYRARTMAGVIDDGGWNARVSERAHQCAGLHRRYAGHRWACTP